MRMGYGDGIWGRYMEMGYEDRDGDKDRARDGDVIDIEMGSVWG